MLILTAHHRAICELLCEGYESAEIAKQLGVKVTTVKHHLNRIFLANQITSGIKRVKLAVLYYRETQGQADEAIHSSAVPAAKREGQDRP